MTANVRQSEVLKAESPANLHDMMQIANCPRARSFNS